MKILHDGKAIIVGLEKVNLGEFPDLKVFGCNMTSCEHLPLEEMEKRGIKLISLKGHDVFLKTITSTAEHTIGLIVALLRNYKKALNGPYKDREAYKGHTLADKYVVLIGGKGRIGTQVAKRLRSFDMLVDPWGGYDSPSLELPNADVVSLHIPLSGNEGFFTKDMFKLMKPTAYFINTSRSGVVEKGALLWALENKIIAGAGVDFIDDEELVNYARDHDNLILTNHIGGCTEEDMARTEEFITSLVNNYIDENTIKNANS